MNAKTAPLDDRPLRTEPIRPTGDAGDGWGRAAAYDAYADGLHTYAIWLLRDHDAAVDALYCTYVLADHHVTQLRQPEHIQPWLYALMRRECSVRMSPESESGSGSGSGAPVDAEAASTSVPASASTARVSGASSSPVDGSGSPSPVSGRLRPPGGPGDPGGSLASLERNLRRAEFHSLEWPESEGLAPAHREILELTIRHGLDSQGLGLVLGLGQSGRSGRGGDAAAAVGGFVGGAIGSVGSQGFGVLADAWRELERSLAAVAVAKASRDHCAQLAELTFGWSGRLTATLRHPLTDHVDGCTRCQHYLHTVIGTPAAPTILPYVAAPRALREILLGELHDPRAALRLGIDHEAIAARVQRFAANGFPAVAEPVPVRRRGGRRAVPKASVVGVAKRRSAGTKAVAPESQEAAVENAAAPRAVTPDAPPSVRRAQGPSAELPRRTPGASMRRADPRVGRQVNEDPDAGGVYRAPGSWAARVLPADTTMEWKPGSSGNFISTPSGRFASRAPIADERAGDANGEAANGRAVHGGAARAGVSGAPTVQLPVRELREPSSGGRPPGRQVSADQLPTRRAAGGSVPSRQVPGRREARLVRRAVLSAVTLGAVGAAAAAAAALLGAASDSHSPQLADIAPPRDPISTQMPNDGLSVSVSTPTAPGASSGVRGSHSPVGGQAPSQGGGATGIGGTVSGSAGASAGVGGGSSSGQGASAANFMVSVNQRDADPHSVTILLRNTGTVPIAWSAAVRDSWIALSQRSGALAAGQSQAIVASVVGGAPSGAWTSAVTFAPGGAVVTLRGVDNPTAGPSSQPTGTPPTTMPTGSATPGSSGQGSASASSGSTPSSTPTASSSSSTSGAGPSTARSVPASSSPSASATASDDASPSASAATSGPSQRPRPGGR